MFKQHSNEGLLIMGLVITGIVLLALTGAAATGAAALSYSHKVLSAVVVSVLGVLLTTAICSSVWAFAFRNEHWATCHVTDKDRGGKDRTYRVYTDNCGTLANEDSLYRGKHNSADVWQKIMPGGTYQFRIVGSRIQFFSQFPNILEVKPVNG